MKRLIVCCDGTWNNPEQENNGIPAPTNVYRIYNAIAENDGSTAQLRYYHPGVGGEGKVAGEGGFLAPLLGGAFGVGTKRHICSAYHWLASHYEEGDEIFLYGFSRGAFTARSLGGFLARGLPDFRELMPDERWSRVHKAYDDCYRKKGGVKLKDKVGKNWALRNGGASIPIRFLGVWDTVGALGIPDDLELINLLDNKKKWQFHDTSLGGHIKSARHAMAIDEVRSSFTVVRWENTSDHEDVKEVWFPGNHSDVGGGYAETDLSNGALLWMIKESKGAKLKFRPNIVPRIKDDPLGVLHDSFRGFFSKLRSRPRNIPSLTQANKNEIHESVFERQKYSPIEYEPYRPTRILKPGEKVTIDVFAKSRWGRTGVFLEKGQRYKFSAEGEWKDSKDVCDWKGTQNDELTKGDVIRAISGFVGKFESMFSRFSKNQMTDLLGTKRSEKHKWFSMIGAVANDGLKPEAVKNDGSPFEHEYVHLPDFETKSYGVKKSGYLYCFPNDVWSAYGNNAGSVELTITRFS